MLTSHQKVQEASKADLTRQVALDQRRPEPGLQAVFSSSSPVVGSVVSAASPAARKAARQLVSVAAVTPSDRDTSFYYLHRTVIPKAYEPWREVCQEPLEQAAAHAQRIRLPRLTIRAQVSRRTPARTPSKKPNTRTLLKTGGISG